jgi:hypothetical protein
VARVLAITLELEGIACGGVVGTLAMRRDQDLIEYGGENDTESVGDDVFGGEVAAEEDAAEEGEAEGVDRCDGDESGELQQGCDDYGYRREGLWAEFGKKGGEEPIEGDRPEDGAEVFVEEPWQIEREKAHGEADRDGDDKERRADRAASVWVSGALIRHVDISDAGDGFG